MVSYPEGRARSGLFGPFASAWQGPSWTASRVELPSPKQYRSISMTKHILAAFSALTMLSPALLHAEEAAIEVQVVDAMNKVFGAQNDFRATHAKGLVAEGTFRG